jgi:hypothetical protein
MKRKPAGDLGKKQDRLAHWNANSNTAMNGRRGSRKHCFSA